MKTFVILAFLLNIWTYYGFAQDSLQIDRETKEEVVKKVASIMIDKYVFAEVGNNMAKHITEQLEKGEYNSFTEIKPFCKKLTSDLRDISNDKHLYVFYSPEEAFWVKANKKMLPEEEIKKINDQLYLFDKKENFGFKKVEILDGNIGYLQIQKCIDSDTLEAALNGAMAFLSNSDAIIIDLRDNGGGSISPLLFSYFLPGEKIDLGSCICRDTTLNEHSWSLTSIPGKRMTEVELYILTNSNTFSAAEYFAYTMQDLKRAVVVGETTKGGAHPVDVLIVKGDILTQISICESYNPRTKTNWEGTGVKPDIEAKSEDALKTAHIKALEHLIMNSIDFEYKKEMGSLLEELKR